MRKRNIENYIIIITIINIIIVHNSPVKVLKMLKHSMYVCLRMASPKVKVWVTCIVFYPLASFVF